MKPSNRVQRTLWSAVIFLALVGVAVVVRRTSVLLPVIVHGYHPPPPAPNAFVAQFTALDDLFAHYPYLTLIHIIPGLLFMILGPLQFSPRIRARHSRFHRINGRIFLTCSAIIGISALVMSFGMPAIGGFNQAAATTLFGTFFLFALAKAFWHIRRREILLHRQWMIRAFATGLAVATIRTIIGFFFATSRFTHLTPREFFGTAFWLGFTLQLIAAEAWIHYAQPSAQTNSPIRNARHRAERVTQPG
ncbi:MAG TPA: DUF2306 domain-containing protein [Candidatus Methylomirabilis sp.]|nr:DUF2306 domain-containing protein [Candidatus Methylomirabilis sp.]